MGLIRMAWILNDLSLKKQFNDSDELLVEFQQLFKVRQSHSELSEKFFCSKSVGAIEVVDNKTFSSIVMQEAPRDFKSQILSWISKKGPFWCDDKAKQDDDYFEYNNIDVTDYGIGECARRKLNEQNAIAFSFKGHFDYSPIPVQHGLPEDVLGYHHIPNIWNLDDLVVNANESIPEPKNWTSAIKRLEEKFEHLDFSEKLIEQISDLPFNITIYERAVELCRVLNEFMENRDNSPESKAKRESLLGEHFNGCKAWFSDESDTDKRKFYEQLKFYDKYQKKKITFTWHGKIKTPPQVRIYFEWPVPHDREKMQIVYFGQKITKK